MDQATITQNLVLLLQSLFTISSLSSSHPRPAWLSGRQFVSKSVVAASIALRSQYVVLLRRCRDLGGVNVSPGVRAVLNSRFQESHGMSFPAQIGLPNHKPCAIEHLELRTVIFHRPCPCRRLAAARRGPPAAFHPLLEAQVLVDDRIGSADLMPVSLDRSAGSVRPILAA